MTPPTVLATKHDFLAKQTRILSKSLAPSRQWRRGNGAAVDDSLTDGAVDDALFWLNHALQQHCSRVYAPAATRQIAEHIDAAYWGVTGAEGAADEGIGRHVNLADEEVIANLPESWPARREAARLPSDAMRYGELTAELSRLSERRRQGRLRVARLQRIKAVMDPFGAGEDGAGVQENLVTRNGELEKELERMRVLLVRVGGRVGTLPLPERHDGIVSIPDDNESDASSD